MSSFSIALSGLTADSAALDVVGNNLANLNTTGYKDSNVSFYDLLQQSVAGGSTQIGGGVSAPQTERVFTQGSIQATGGNFDAAINGNGFFVVQDPSGNTLYTRAGNFNLDANGNLVTATGQFVQGWAAQNGVVNTSGAIGNITIPSDALQTPSATQNFSLSLNLNAAGVAGEASGSFSTPIQVVDSLGETHDLTVNFTEQSPGNWNYEVDIPGADLTSGTAGTPSAVADGSLSFDANGNLTPTGPSDGAGSGRDYRLNGRRQRHEHQLELGHREWHWHSRSYAVRRYFSRFRQHSGWSARFPGDAGFHCQRRRHHGAVLRR